MITLKSEKGLSRIENWDDIESRPGFVGNLDPAKHKLADIIGRYVFKEKIRCGLTNCHTPHAKGYIVVTKDGLETNIGKDCGKTYFGVDFETLSAQLDRAITEQDNRDRLWNFSFKIEELEHRIHELREGDKGANWVHGNIQPLLTINAGCPEEVVRRVSSMIKVRSGTLLNSREATEAEIEQRETAEGRRLARPFYVDEPIAQIAGMEALYPENDLRKLLVLDLTERLKAFQECDIDALTYRQLGDWVRWVDSIESTLNRATRSVSQGQTLLDPGNLQPFFNILTRHEDKNTFRTYLRGLRSEQ